MEVWDRGNVPGATSQRTCLEGVEIVDEVGSDHLDDIVREQGWVGRFVCGTWLVGYIVKMVDPCEVGDGHFNEFVWETVGRLMRSTRLLGRITEWAAGLSLAPTPNGYQASRKLCPHCPNCADIRAIYTH